VRTLACASGSAQARIAISLDSAAQVGSFTQGIRVASSSLWGIDIMSLETSNEQSFRIERHGEVAVLIPSPKVEEMHEALIQQAAKLVISSLKEDPPTGIIIDLSGVNYFGSVFVSFLLRCHMFARKQGTEIVLAGASEPARELLHLLDLETVWAMYSSRQEAIEAIGASD
jgi:anti-sigma B factor antagonist